MGMSSINTNMAAMTALQSLQQTSKEMLTTQNRISTGLKVGSAADNAAYWSIATTMRSDNDALSTVQDALGLGKGTVNVAYTAMNSSIDLVSKIKTKLVAAAAPGVDRAKIQSEIGELQKQLKGIADFGKLLGRELAFGQLFGDRLQCDEVDHFFVHALGFGRRFGRQHQRQHAELGVVRCFDSYECYRRHPRRQARFDRRDRWYGGCFHLLDGHQRVDRQHDRPGDA